MSTLQWHNIQSEVRSKGHCIVCWMLAILFDHFSPTLLAYFLLSFFSLLVNCAYSTGDKSWRLGTFTDHVFTWHESYYTVSSSPSWYVALDTQAAFSVDKFLRHGAMKCSLVTVYNYTSIPSSMKTIECFVQHLN